MKRKQKTSPPHNVEKRDLSYKKDIEVSGLQLPTMAKNAWGRQVDIQHFVTKLSLHSADKLEFQKLHVF